MGRHKLYEVDESLLIQKISEGETIHCISVDMGIPSAALTEKIRQLKKKYDANSLVQLVLKIKKVND